MIIKNYLKYILVCIHRLMLILITMKYDKYSTLTNYSNHINYYKNAIYKLLLIFSYLFIEYLTDLYNFTRLIIDH